MNQLNVESPEYESSSGQSESHIFKSSLGLVLHVVKKRFLDNRLRCLGNMDYNI